MRSKIVTQQHNSERGAKNTYKIVTQQHNTALVVVLACAAVLADGAGECGATPPDQMALKLAPCVSAAQDPGAAPSGGCCAAVEDIGRRSPECLCAVLLSSTAKSAGIKQGVAITIPKHCNLANRPIGYKCGDYTMPTLQD